jgi:hypothetical protein
MMLIGLAGLGFASFRRGRRSFGDQGPFTAKVKELLVRSDLPMQYRCRWRYSP